VLLAAPVSDIALLAVRGLVSGILVVVFALIGEVFTPKAFSGGVKTTTK
jgi:hypothetical protein